MSQMWLVRREKSSTDSSFRVYFDRRQSAHPGHNQGLSRNPCWVADFPAWAAAKRIWPHRSLPPRPPARPPWMSRSNAVFDGTYRFVLGANKARERNDAAQARAARACDW